MLLDMVHAINERHCCLAVVPEHVRGGKPLQRPEGVRHEVCSVRRQVGLLDVRHPLIYQRQGAAAPTDTIMYSQGPPMWQNDSSAILARSWREPMENIGGVSKDVRLSGRIPLTAVGKTIMWGPLTTASSRLSGSQSSAPPRASSTERTPPILLAALRTAVALPPARVTGRPVASAGCPLRVKSRSPR